MSSRGPLDDLLEVMVILLVLALFGMLGVTLGSGWLTLVGLLVAVVLIGVFLRRAGERLRDLGVRSPAGWAVATALALAVAVAAQTAALLLIRLTGFAPELERFDFLRGRPGALAGMLVAAWLTAALPEELIFRGFLMRRLASFLGGTDGAWKVSLLLTSLLFGLAHAYQGRPGMVLTGASGLLLGALYLGTGRNLWVVILTHGFMDTLALLMIFAGVDRWFG